MTRRRLTNLSVITCCLAILTVAQGTTVAELYFSNFNNILRLTNGSSLVAISDLSAIDAIDCNICDHLIYWVDQPGAIRRANPTDGSTIETVIDTDLDELVGLAVDWVGNNIYFSHKDRIEVATCNGQYRRVLAHGLSSVGTIAINILTGYLYYVDNLVEIRCMTLNGSLEEVLYVEQRGEVKGLEVEIFNNVLYWTVSGHTDINSLSLSSSTGASNTPETISTDGSIPHELIIRGSTVYWTQLELFDSRGRVTETGALYTSEIGTGVVTRLLPSTPLSPNDLCYFFDNSLPESGCAMDNGGCSHLCLTVPSSDGSTEAQCACPTGITITSDGTCPRYPHQFLLFTQRQFENPANTDVRMISLDTPSVFIDILTPVTIAESDAKFIAYDITQHQVYWSQLSPPQIRRASLDGSGEETLIEIGISAPESLAVDPYSMNLYWIDSKLDRIEVYALLKGHRKTLVTTGTKPQGLALDLRNRFMYWTDLDNTNPRVERCHLDGSQCEEILSDLSPSKIREPATITADPLSDWVYFAETANDKVFLYNGVTGDHEERGFSGGHPNDIGGLAVHGDYLYWTDRSGSSPTMGRVDRALSGNSMAVLDVGGLHSVLAANQSAESITSLACSMCEQLCLPSDTTTPTCACANNLILNDDLVTCNDPEAVLVMSTSDGVYQITPATISWNKRIDLPFSITPTPPKLSVLWAPDFNTSTLYWIDPADKLIYSSVMSEYSPQALVKCCVLDTADLAVDWYGRNLYWTDSSQRVIEVIQLEVSNPRRIVLYRVPEELGEPDLLTVDPLGGHLYWSPKSRARIYQWRMDGRSVMDESAVFWESLDHREVFGMSMNYTSEVGVSHQLYFGAITMANHSDVYSKDVDNLDSTATNFGRFEVRAIALAALKGNFYFLAERNVRIIDHDHPGTANIRSTQAALRSPTPDNVPYFTIAHHSLQPGLHECSVNNNECGAGAVCLVESGVRGHCVCPPLEASIIEEQNGLMYFSCAPTDAFVLIATEDAIYHLPFVDITATEESSTVQPLPLGVVGSIRTMSYDPVTKSVLYTDNTIGLHSVALDSSSETSLPLPDNLEPSSLAFDWVGGHIFSIESSAFQIELTTINGEGVGSVLNFTSKENLYSTLNLLGEVAFNSVSNMLYWTYVSLSDGLGARLLTMSPGDQNQVVREINLEGSKIRGLTAESGTTNMLWISERESTKIEKYVADSGKIQVLYSGSADIEAVTSMLVDGSSHLFWFDRGEGAIYTLQGNESLVYRRWSPGSGRVVGMVSHLTKAERPSPCRDSTRPCSHYCLRGADPQCACPSNSKLSSDGNECLSGCDSVLRSCGGAYQQCFPRTYWCDHIPHCRNGADEECDCPANHFGCHRSTHECRPMSAKCDGVLDCPDGEDEEDCCTGNEFGCYVTVETGDLLEGKPPMKYMCFNNDSICDGFDDCMDPSVDEPDSCPTEGTPAPPPSSDTSISIPIIITFAILAIVGIVIFVAVCCYCTRALRKKREGDLASNRMVTAYNHGLINYKRGSPQLRVESVSDYYSEFSGGTNSTHIGNNSHASQNSMFKRQSAAGLSTDPSNPPPSPMTLRRSPTALTDIEDDESVFSDTMSEFPVPPGPTPSLNYDDMGSDNLSFSVSQSQYPATISGRAPNPLLLQQQQRSVYPYPPYHYNGGGYHHSSALPNGHGHQWGVPKRAQPPANGKNPYNCHHYPTSHTRKELDSLARTETESTISITTVSTENRGDEEYFDNDEAMSYAPPGRPPSPVTVVSEYPAPPMSPDSTLSGFSEDECSERQLHQT